MQDNTKTNCQACGAEIMRITAELSGGYCYPCAKKADTANRIHEHNAQKDKLANYCKFEFEGSDKIRVVRKADIDRSIHVDGPNSHPTKFEKCWVSSLFLREVRHLDEKYQISNISVTKCKIGAATVPAVDLIGLRIDGLTTKSIIRARNPLLKHCVFSGKIGSIMIIDEAKPEDPNHRLNREIRDYNNRAYRDLDWAIDIRNADFTEFDCRSVPAEKILINDETQIRVNIQKLKEAKTEDDYFNAWISIILESRSDHGCNTVLTTSKRLKRYNKEIDFFDFLRSSGYELT